MLVSDINVLAPSWNSEFYQVNEYNKGGRRIRGGRKGGKTEKRKKRSKFVTCHLGGL